MREKECLKILAKRNKPSSDKNALLYWNVFSSFAPGGNVSLRFQLLKNNLISSPELHFLN